MRSIQGSYLYSLPPVHLCPNSSQKMDFLKIQKELKESMLKRLDEMQEPAYIHIPKSFDKCEYISKIRYFLDNGLQEFLNRCSQIVPCLTDQDVQSLGSFQLTPRAREFVSLFDHLERSGFPGQRVLDRPINFWSGKVAEDRTYRAQDEISIRNFLPTYFMNNICHKIQKENPHEKEIVHRFYLAISKCYSTAASGNVNVYISSDKISESPGFNVPNFFWEAELPVLQMLVHRGIVQDIQIHLYDHIKKAWNDPVSFFSKEGSHISVHRRSVHPLDNPSTVDRFLRDPIAEEDYEKWKETQPRPEITINSLKKVTNHWRRVTFHLKTVT